MRSASCSTRSCARPSTPKTTKELDLGSWTLPKDTVAGVTIHWLGKIGGTTIVEMRVRWRKGDALEPDWDVGMGWTIEIQGRPTITTKIDILPPPYFEATTMEEFMVLGHILTALPVVNAIPAVVAAAARDHHLRRHPAPAAQGLRPDLTERFLRESNEVCDRVRGQGRVGFDTIRLDDEGRFLHGSSRASRGSGRPARSHP